MDRAGFTHYYTVLAADLDSRYDGYIGVELGVQQFVENEFSLLAGLRFAKGWVSGADLSISGTNLNVTAGHGFDGVGLRVQVRSPQTIPFGSYADGTYYLLAYVAEYRDPASVFTFTPTAPGAAPDAITFYRRVLTSCTLVVSATIPSDASFVLGAVSVVSGTPSVLKNVDLSYTARQVSTLKSSFLNPLPYVKSTGDTVVQGLVSFASAGQASVATTNPVTGLQLGGRSRTWLFGRDNATTTDAILALGDLQAQRFIVESWSGGIPTSIASFERTAIHLYSPVSVHTDLALDATKNLTVGGVAVALSTHLHDARYSQLGHGHVIADVTGLQSALDLKATVTSLGSANATFLVEHNSDGTHKPVNEAFILSASGVTVLAANGQWAQLDSLGRAAAADASAVATARVAGVIAGGKLIVAGIARAVASGLTPGRAVYLSGVGSYTQTVPTSGLMVRVGLAVNAADVLVQIGEIIAL